MIKLYLLVFGLTAVVPKYDVAGNLTGATVLILNADGVTTKWGAYIRPHEARIDYRDVDGGSVTWSGPGFEDLRISLEGKLASRPMAVDEEDRILKLNQLYRKGSSWSPKSLTVRPGCLGPVPQQQCLDHDDRMLLSGRIELSGGWKVRPVEIDELRRPVLMKDRSTFGFVSLNESQPKFSPHVSPLAGGLLFEADVDLEDFTIERSSNGGPWQNVKVVPANDCREFGQQCGECVRIEVRNIPQHAHQRLECGEAATDRIDSHFDRVYELLVDPPAWRFLPFLFELNSDDCIALHRGEPGGDPPEVKCPSGWVEDYP